MTIDYDRDQLSYALANALKERDEARQAWYEMHSSFERSRDEAEKLMRERDEAREQNAKLREIAEGQSCARLFELGAVPQHQENSVNNLINLIKLNNL